MFLAGVGLLTARHLWRHPLSWARAQAGWGLAFVPGSFLIRRWRTMSDAGFLTYVATDPVDALTGIVATVTLVASAPEQFETAHKLLRKRLHQILVLHTSRSASQRARPQMGGRQPPVSTCARN